MSKADHDKEMKIEAARAFNEIRDNFKSRLDPEGYPGSLSLIYELDTLVWVLTGDGQNFVGELSSFDTYGNVFLSKAKMRTYNPSISVKTIPFGCVLIRAEDVALIGRIDYKKDSQLLASFEISPEAGDEASATVEL